MGDRTTSWAEDRRETANVLKMTLVIWLSTVVAFSGVLAVMAGGRLPLWAYVWLGVLPVSGIPLSWLLYRVARGASGRSVIGRWLILAPVIGAVCAVQAVCDDLAFHAVQRAFGITTGRIFAVQGVAMNFLLYLWLFGMYAVAVDLIAMTSKAQRLAREAVEARELAREAQLELLRFQLNPHFLFNTLNNISSLVITDRGQQAERMIGRLSRFLRSVLDADGAPTAPLHAELAAIEDYLDIEAARFDQTLSIAIDCPADLSAALTPCLILQPLVENAIKYAVTPSRGAASIRIEARRIGDQLVLAVQDSGGGPAHAGDLAAAGCGVGLRNVRNRLAVLYGDDADLVTTARPEGFRAEIRLPFQIALQEAA